MISRRHFLQAGLATSALYGASSFGSWSRLAAQQRLTQSDLIGTSGPGSLTVIHVTDIHAQTVPLWFREPEVNLGVGDAVGRPPHLTGAAFRAEFGIEKGSALDYALTYEDFVALGRTYGRMGGLDRIATVVKAIRAERPDALLLDGGDTWQGSLPALKTQGADMVKLFRALGTNAMTSHFEFTLGIDRVTEIVENELGFPFLAANAFDTTWDEPAYPAFELFERAGTKVAVIGQAFPYLPVANPKWLFPDLSFGIRKERLASVVDEVRAGGAEVVILLSHNGFDVDRKIAVDVPGIDVILTGHTHDAIPEPVQVGKTFMIASGSHGKFVSRVDIDVEAGAMKGLTHRLIPIFSDVIAPDPEMTALVEETRAPFKAEMSEVLGKADGLLYRRGNFNGTWDDLICDALLTERDAEIALSPGFRWGSSVMPGEDITREHVFNATAMSYPQAYRTEMTGATLKTVLEDVADNLFNQDPYYQQGGDMVRVGGMGYRIDIQAKIGARLSDMTLLSTGEAIDPTRSYVVAGWASVNEGTEGPPIWDVVEAHIRNKGTVSPSPNTSVVVAG
jgi:sulfur-oxidizing protein SoxB